MPMQSGSLLFGLLERFQLSTKRFLVLEALPKLTFLILLRQLN
jgi:hypothetical protein